MRIVLCGSMMAAKDMVRVETILQERGHQVELPEFAREYAAGENVKNHQSESLADKINHDLIRRLYEKIKNADAIVVVNIDRKGIAGYIGGNAFLEMGFAYVLGKKTFLLNPVPEMGYSDELHAMQPIILGGNYERVEG